MTSTSKLSTASLRGWSIFFFIFALVGHAAAQTWIDLTPTGSQPPAPRLFHGAIYAPNSNRMIVFGGVSGTLNLRPFFNDVWVLSNADGTDSTAPAWTQLIPSGTPPSPRGWHRVVYDASSNRMILFAGNPNIGSCFGTANDVWVLSNADGTDSTAPAWTQLIPSGTPPSPRGLHSAVYDPINNRMIVFGGNLDACSVAANDIWVLKDANGHGSPEWTQLFPLGNAPSPRFAHSAVYDPTSNRMIVFGGQHATGIANDVWVLENANGLGGTPTWTLLNTTGDPGPHAHHTAVYDSAVNRMIIWGCGQACIPVASREGVWVLENANGLGGTPTWTQLNTTGGPPRARDIHSAVFNPSNKRMTIFAGREYNPPNFPALNDVWVLTEASGIFPPEQAVQNLVDDVVALNLQKGITNSLDSKLDAVLNALEDLNANNDVAAINALEAFINAVEAQRNKHISSADADELIAAAQAIIAQLQGT